MGKKNELIGWSLINFLHFLSLAFCRGVTLMGGRSNKFLLEFKMMGIKEREREKVCLCDYFSCVKGKERAF